MSNPDENFPFRLMILPLLRKKNIIPAFLMTQHRTDIPITEPEEPEHLRKIPRCMPTGRPQRSVIGRCQRKIQGAGYRCGRSYHP